MAKKSKSSVLKMPTQKTVQKTGIAVALTTVGILASRVIASFVPENYKKYARVGVGALGAGLASATTEPYLQLAGVGVATLQVVDGVKEYATKQTVQNETLKIALGMNAPLGLNGVEYTPISSWSPQETQQPKEIEVVEDQPLFN